MFEKRNGTKTPEPQFGGNEEARATEVGSLQQQLVIKGPWLPRLSPEVTECTVLYRQSQESCFFLAPRA